MRNISCSVTALGLTALAMLAVVACGPSGKQVSSAKQARYQGDRAQLFAVVKQTVASKYKIELADEASFGVKTEGRWHSPEGQVMPSGEQSTMPEGSYNISLVVEILPDGDRHIVSVRPHILRHSKSKDPELVDLADPNLPDWARGKGDSLQVALYDALKQYEVKGAAGPAPAAPASVPAPAPATPAPTSDPAAGSATPPPAP